MGITSSLYSRDISFLNSPPPPPPVAFLFVARPRRRPAQWAAHRHVQLGAWSLVWPWTRSGPSRSRPPRRCSPYTARRRSRTCTRHAAGAAATCAELPISVCDSSRSESRRLRRSRDGAADERFRKVGQMDSRSCEPPQGGDRRVTRGRPRQANKLVSARAGARGQPAATGSECVASGRGGGTVPLARPSRPRNGSGFLEPHFAATGSKHSIAPARQVEDKQLGIRVRCGCPAPHTTHAD